MGAYKYIRKVWARPKAQLGDVWRQRVMEWRREPVTLRIDRPTRLDRARSLGYRPKEGIILVRQRVTRSQHRRPHRMGGRMPKKMRVRMVLRKNFQLIAEERANKQFENCEVLNSYYVAEDGRYFWFEVILADRSNKSVLADPRFSWLKHGHRGRVFHGKTSSGRKIRGLRYKGLGVVKARPSRRAHARTQ